MRRLIAILIYPELFELENQNKVQMQFVFNLSNKWKEDVKAKERGINKLHKKIKYLIKNNLLFNTNFGECLIIKKTLNHHYSK